MSIHWNALLAVFGVALGSAVTVVALIALALRGLSPATDGPARRSRSAIAGTAACLALAAAIVLAGLWVMVAR